MFGEDYGMIMFFCISPQVKRWFYVESEKHLAPLDSYSLSVSSIRDMRQSLAQFMEESTVSVHVVSYAKENGAGMLLSQDAQEKASVRFHSQQQLVWPSHVPLEHFHWHKTQFWHLKG